MSETIPAQDLRHLAFFYRDQADYLAGVAGFVRRGLARADAAFVAVPGGRAGPLRAALGAQARQVAFADMTELGRNPGRIIPAVRAFLGRHAGQRVSYVGEPAWAARSGRELLEAARHEALVNLAFAGAPVTILCPYEPDLPADVLADARRTHPLLFQGSRELASVDYLGAQRLPARCEEPLPAPPPGAACLLYHTDLHLVRAAVSRHAERAGLPPDRAADLVLAVSELAANTLRHTTAGGVLRLWQEPGELICETSDQGWITDPLAGRVRPAGNEPGGHGLWLVHQVCDLVEQRTDPGGTVVRVHMRLP